MTSSVIAFNWIIITIDGAPMNDSDISRNNAEHFEGERERRKNTKQNIAEHRKRIWCKQLNCVRFWLFRLHSWLVDRGIGIKSPFLSEPTSLFAVFLLLLLGDCRIFVCTQTIKREFIMVIVAVHWNCPCMIYWSALTDHPLYYYDEI